MMKLGGLKPILLVFILLVLVPIAHSQTLFAGSGTANGGTSSTSSSSNSLAQTFCTGTAGSITGTTAGGLLNNQILSNQTSGEQSVLSMSLLIMLVMLLIVAILWMISYVISLDTLRQLVKAEIGEVIITGIIVLVLVGSFSIASASFSTSGFALVGQGFGKQIYADDCIYLATASVNMLPPFFAINIVRWVIQSVASVTLNLEPIFFGFTVSPLAGLGLFDTLLATLDTIAGIFIAFNMGALVLLGIIYAIFPIFLYAGIIFRTLPWTRAAGGAFLGVFIGFYIVFPLLLHIMLAGYLGNPSLIPTVLNSNGNPSQLTANYITSANQNSGSGTTTSVAGFIWTSIKDIFTTAFSANGIAGGFIVNVIEPSLFTILVVIISFIISFDFAEACGDLLGAPSLRASHIFNKVL